METIKESKEYLKNNYGKGCKCPSCGQMVKLYKRKLTSSMAYALILIYKSKNLSFFHVENYLKDQNCPSSIRGDFSKLKYWKLIEPLKSTREDGSSRNGFYKLTQEGINFIKGGSRVSSHVFLFDNKLQGFADTTINMVESLGNKFNYSELMN